MSPSVPGDGGDTSAVYFSLSLKDIVISSRNSCNDRVKLWVGDPDKKGRRGEEGRKGIEGAVSNSIHSAEYDIERRR
ncbi:hypothetical protein EYC84_010871 [Monilinia fructicola]|uniref:Uncharacterized protein n=1 Tax=Monilinia fructicola TaxID=38448 RepID=A0A5M9JB80_MONFR|nr:hypothetical protein EYC84_010871 [Monilinia fructicola]